MRSKKLAKINLNTKTQCSTLSNLNSLRCCNFPELILTCFLLKKSHTKFLLSETIIANFLNLMKLICKVFINHYQKQVNISKMKQMFLWIIVIYVTIQIVIHFYSSSSSSFPTLLQVNAIWCYPTLFFVQAPPVTPDFKV